MALHCQRPIGEAANCGVGPHRCRQSGWKMMFGLNEVLRHRIRKQVRWHRCCDRNPCSGLSSWLVDFAYSFAYF
jgi:hypothetical protein